MKMEIVKVTPIKVDTGDTKQHEEITSLTAKPSPNAIDKITYITLARNKVDLQLYSKNIYHSIIFKALKVSLSSAWHFNLTVETQTTIGLQLRRFIQWINEIDRNRDDINRYQCLTDYDAYRRNDVGVKHSFAARIRRMIIDGLTADCFSNIERTYLETLLKFNKFASAGPAKSKTLTNWFSSKDIRQLLGEEKYLQLESPSRLILSFRITVAVTLQVLLEARQIFVSRVPVDRYKALVAIPPRKLGPTLLRELGVFHDDGTPADLLTSLLFVDSVFQDRRDWWIKKFMKKGHVPKQFCETSKDRQLYMYKKLQLFTASYPERYSQIEERLLAWLCACETVQPSDIAKLKSTDYAAEYDEDGELLMMQLKYYKGRAGNVKETALLMATDCWTRALYGYINGLPDAGPLFKHPKPAGCAPVNSGGHSKTSFLFELWKHPDFLRRLDKELRRSSSTPLFLEAIFAVAKNREDNRATNGGYLRFFRCQHIKNTAVHAGTDRYRESDLINHHSHTSITEKHSYLTDQNKDWVNRCGRITRLVLHDLQNGAFHPSIEKARQKIDDAELKTTLIAATGQTHANINNRDVYHADLDDLGVQIIVSDSVDSAIYFLHYINQAEVALPSLMKSRPDYVEKTILIKVEWMTRTLARMQSTAQAKQQYSLVKEFLPPVFDFISGTII